MASALPSWGCFMKCREKAPERPAVAAVGAAVGTAVGAVGVAVGAPREVRVRRPELRRGPWAEWMPNWRVPGEGGGQESDGAKE